MSTLFVGEQTYPVVLHQPQALECLVVENTPAEGERNRPSTHASGCSRDTGKQHDRDESAAASPGGSTVTPNPHHVGRGEWVGDHPKPKEAVQSVFVLDKHGKPLSPTHPGRARELLNKGRARVVRQVPFVIRLTDRTVSDSKVDPLVVGVDPGSRHTGIAVARESEIVDIITGEITVTREGLFLAQLDHRGPLISKKIGQRSGCRRRRRSKNLRYRPARFLNRKPAKCSSCGSNAQHGKSYCRPCQDLPRASRGQGMRGARRLPPSLRHRVLTTTTWVQRLSRWAPVSQVNVEWVKFDTQLLENPDIHGIQYQQGTLLEVELRQYVLEKWGRKCVYCHATGVPLEIDHVIPKSKGGTNRASNLVPACRPCNRTKDNRPVEDFLSSQPRLLAGIKAQLKTPLKDAAAMNMVRYATTDSLQTLGIPVHRYTGGRTKYNRRHTGLNKTHALDALLVGEVGHVSTYPGHTLIVRCMGRGQHQRTRVTKHGFPRGYLPRTKTAFGFQTGDLVKAVIPAGVNRGTYTGRVAIRSSGSFNLKTPTKTLQGINHKYCQVLQKADGYQYHQNTTEGDSGNRPPANNTHKPGAAPLGPKRPSSRR